jgi:hypothetical protein
VSWESKARFQTDGRVMRSVRVSCSGDGGITDVPRVAATGVVSPIKQGIDNFFKNQGPRGVKYRKQRVKTPIAWPVEMIFTQCLIVIKGLGLNAERGIVIDK